MANIYTITEAQRNLVSLLIANYVNTHKISDFDKMYLDELKERLELD